MNDKFDDRQLNQSQSADFSERERFLLLSAYFDGEATSEERQLVQHWLDHDPRVRQQYKRMRQLRQHLQDCPVPSGDVNPQQLAWRVFQRLRQERLQRFALWGSSAIAALFVAGLVGTMNGSRNEETSIAQIPQPVTPIVQVATVPVVKEETLMVALNRPVLQIPKMATATPATHP